MDIDGIALYLANSASIENIYRPIRSSNDQVNTSRPCSLILAVYTFDEQFHSLPASYITLCYGFKIQSQVPTPALILCFTKEMALTVDISEAQPRFGQNQFGVASC